MEFPNDFDEPNQMGIEFGKLLRGHPQFLMDPTADHLDGVSLSELGVDMEPGHIPGPTVLDVPVLGDLDRVFLIEDRIENRLIRQARREGSPARVFDEFEFFRADRSEEGECLHRA